MITARMLEVFNCYDGDPDRFVRFATARDGTEMPDSAWSEIEAVVSSLVIVQRGLASPAYAEEVMATLTRIADGPAVVEQLKDMARARARIGSR